jgi:hypothetical protein
MECNAAGESMPTPSPIVDINGNNAIKLLTKRSVFFKQHNLISRIKDRILQERKEGQPSHAGILREVVEIERMARLQYISSSALIDSADLDRLKLIIGRFGGHSNGATCKEMGKRGTVATKGPAGHFSGTE